MDDRKRQSLQLIRDEANDTEAGDCALEFDISDLLSHLLILCLLNDILGRLGAFVWSQVLSIGQSLALGEHVGELAIAVVDELDQDIVGALTCSPVEQQHLKEVQQRNFVIDLKTRRIS